MTKQHHQRIASLLLPSRPRPPWAEFVRAAFMLGAGVAAICDEPWVTVMFLLVLL